MSKNHFVISADNEEILNLFNRWLLNNENLIELEDFSSLKENKITKIFFKWNVNTLNLHIKKDD